MEQQMEQYCKQLRALLFCPPDDAKHCIADVRRTVERLRQEEPEITVDEVMEFLGQPEDVAQMFLETLDPVRVKQYHKRKKLFARLLVGLLAAALLAALYAAYYFMVNPRMVYTVEFYESEPYEDPTAISPYINKGD